MDRLIFLLFPLFLSAPNCLYRIPPSLWSRFDALRYFLHCFYPRADELFAFLDDDSSELGAFESSSYSDVVPIIEHVFSSGVVRYNAPEKYHSVLLRYHETESITCADDCCKLFELFDFFLYLDVESFYEEVHRWLQSANNAEIKELFSRLSPHCIEEFVRYINRKTYTDLCTKGLYEYYLQRPFHNTYVWECISDVVKTEFFLLPEYAPYLADDENKVSTVNVLVVTKETEQSLCVKDLTINILLVYMCVPHFLTTGVSCNSVVLHQLPYEKTLQLDGARLFLRKSASITGYTGALELEGSVENLLLRDCHSLSVNSNLTVLERITIERCDGLELRGVALEQCKEVLINNSVDYYICSSFLQPVFLRLLSVSGDFTGWSLKRLKSLQIISYWKKNKVLFTNELYECGLEELNVWNDAILLTDVKPNWRLKKLFVHYFSRVEILYFDEIEVLLVEYCRHVVISGKCVRRLKELKLIECHLHPIHEGESDLEYIFAENCENLDLSLWKLDKLKIIKASKTRYDVFCHIVLPKSLPSLDKKNSMIRVLIANQADDVDLFEDP